MSIPNAGPDIPYSSSASDIPSGVNLGPLANVGGETWDWSATRDRYVPGEKVSKATYADLTTLATQMGLGNNAASIGIKCWLVNSFAPDGMTRMYWTGTLWAPVDGQVLYNSLSRTALDTVTGLTAGAVAEIWSSPILPDWYFVDGARLDIVSRVSVTDPSATASASLMAYVAGAASTSTDAQQAALGYTAAVNTFEAGIPDGFNGITWRDGGNMKSRGGQLVGNPSSASTLVTRNVGSFLAGAMRVRIRVVPGATTTVFRPYGARLVAGGIEA